MAKKSTTKRKYRKKSKKRGGRMKVIVACIVMIILSGIAAVTTWLSLSCTHTGEGVKIPKGNYIYGIDISRYQSDVSWKDLKLLVDKEGITTGSLQEAYDTKDISFVFIKATEGTSLTDKHFKNHWKKAKQSGIRRGPYHFFRSSKDPDKQARHFIKTVGKISEDDLPPVLDIETIHDGCSHKILNERALIWLKAVEEHYGRKPIVYSSASFINKILCKEIKESYPIWVAHYETAMPLCKRWDVWQFTDKAVVYGIDGNVDLNVTTKEFLKSI